MKIHYINVVPSSYQDGENEPKCLDAEIDSVLHPFRHEIETVWYWYVSGHWDGSGCMAIKGTDGAFRYASLNHCSCDGPLANLMTDLRRDSKSIDDLLVAFRHGADLESRTILMEAIKSTP